MDKNISNYHTFTYFYVVISIKYYFCQKFTMTFAAIATIVIICLALILFITEVLSIDIVALLVLTSFVLLGVITPEEGVAGFSNKATVTVMFLFILSTALLKTGALQYLANSLSKIFIRNFNQGMLLMMFLIAFVSAFINNTPVVAVFIPVILQIAHTSGQSPMKMLIPLSFASIFGGMTTLIGTSTNILVSGIIASEGLPELKMFQLAPIGIVLFLIGTAYIIFFGKRLLPERNKTESLKAVSLRNYISEIQILADSQAVGQSIMNADLVKELNMDVIEVRRGKSVFYLPQGDFIIAADDILKVKCSVDKMVALKDKAKLLFKDPIKIGDQNLRGKETSIIELIITSDSELEGKTLKQADFRRRYRATPLAIQHREQIQNENLYDVKLRAGDVILAEMKNHFIKEVQKKELENDSPFVILSENKILDFDKSKFIKVLTVLVAVIASASLGLLDIMIAAILGTILLVLTRVIQMKEAYDAINWKVIFLLAGSLSFGVAMKNSGLDVLIGQGITHTLGDYGPYIVLSSLYIVTSLLTEVMSNNASAAIMAPIAITTASALGLQPLPFIIIVTIAASASFITPIGYQTNTMVFSAGGYKFRDFARIGVLLNIIFWITASIMVPVIYPF